MANALHITLTRSVIGQNESQRATVKALGLNKMHQTVIKTDNEAVRGMINKVSHLVTVEEK
ncbi:MAG: 50S ribosomal protein L30 [Turicibacter sp.]